MTQEAVKALPEATLSQVIIWAQDELKARAEQRKQVTIAKIKELAGTAGLSITINGRRGRPPKAKVDAVPQRAGKL